MKLENFLKGDNMRKIWFIVANWIISPYWYVIALVLSMASKEIELGSVAIHGPLDILITLLLFFVFLPIILVSLMIHHTVWMLLYYSISGAIICILYRKYLQLNKKQSKPSVKEVTQIEPKKAKEE
jgi:hypothetical protein